MKFVRIFETHSQGLFSVRYPDSYQDEFEMLFDFWQDVFRLRTFFMDYKAYLQKGYYSGITIEDAVLRTMKDAQKLEALLFDMAAEKNNHLTLDMLFKPLDNNLYKEGYLIKSKAYGVIEKSWIRLYAIKLDKNYYIVTGGAIKLTLKMHENENTLKELNKLNTCRSYLQNAGVFDVKGMTEIL